MDDIKTYFDVIIGASSGAYIHAEMKDEEIKTLAELMLLKDTHDSFTLLNELGETLFTIRIKDVIFIQRLNS